MKETESIRGYDRAERNIQKLYKMRMKRGITQKRLSQLSGVNEHTLRDYENGRSLPTINNYNKLAQTLGWNKIDETCVPKVIRTEPPKVEKLLDLLEPVKIPTSPTFTFTEAHIYKIYAEIRDEEYIFCYEGKQGIHHMFREIRGGWSRTFTDAQLIGKKVKEVDKNEAN